MGKGRGSACGSADRDKHVHKNRKRTFANIRERRNPRGGNWRGGLYLVGKMGLVATTHTHTFIISCLATTTTPFTYPISPPWVDLQSYLASFQRRGSCYY